jgi:hypothetical protein
MKEEAGARTIQQREIVASLDREFARLHSLSSAIIQSTPTALLYDVPAQPPIASLHSIGENVLRSAAAVEQTFGGITANLWDDPFEWTLPEYLTTPAKIAEHLGEVEATRKRAFSSFADDTCLLKHIATPTNERRPLIELLLVTLVRASGYQGQAVATLKMLSGISPPGFTI